MDALWLYEEPDRIRQRAFGWIDYSVLPERYQIIETFDYVAGGYLDSARFVECGSYAVLRREDLRVDDPDELDDTPPPADCEYKVVPYTLADGSAELAVVRSDERVIFNRYHWSDEHNRTVHCGALEWLQHQAGMQCVVCGNIHDLRAYGVATSLPYRIVRASKFRRCSGVDIKIACECSPLATHDLKALPTCDITGGTQRDATSFALHTGT